MNNNDFNNIEIPKSLDSVIEKSFGRAKNDRSRFIKKTLAATICFGIFTGASMLSYPTLAEDFPFIESTLNKLGISKNYKDYTQYIGQEKDLNGVNFKIEELVFTEHRILVGVLATSENKIAAKDYDIKIRLDGLGKIPSASSSNSSYNLNDNTVMYYYEFTTSYSINPVSDVNLDIVESIKDVTSKEKSLDHISFNIKVDETDRFSKTKNLTINNNDIDFNFKFSEVESYLNYKDPNYAAEKSNGIKVIKVNNQFKPWLNGIENEENGIIFNNIGYTKEEIENSKSIEIISIGAKNSKDQWIESNEPLSEKDNIFYSKAHKFSNGTKGEVIDIKRENKTIILKYKTHNKNKYNLMWGYSLFNYNEKTKESYGIGNYPTIIDEGNDIFTIKFENVPENTKVILGNIPLVDIVEFKDECLKIK